MKITRAILGKWSGKLRAAATILECEANECDHAGSKAKGFREAEKDLRQSADQAFRSSRSPRRERRKK